jgi:D-3-phosphoglycerate dehydrogenase / 2-oxoglutarate reductase
MDILISEQMESPETQRLAKRFSVVEDGTLWKNPVALKEKIRDAKTIIVRNQTQLTSDVLRAAPNLTGIGRLGVGLDNIDVKTATELGIVVIAPLDANATSVAEFTMALILSLTRKIPAANSTTKAGKWLRQACLGTELDRKTLTVCGFGRIGRGVATRARAFGMRIAVFDPFIQPDSPHLRETGAILCGKLEDALGRADFISVHSPLTPETKHMFNAKAFAATKPGACFINTSRGGVVDELALLDALERKHLGGAALDVREIEPPKTSIGFENLENVILTPHIASFTNEAQSRTYEAIAADIERLLTGQPAANFVNMPKPKR